VKYRFELDTITDYKDFIRDSIDQIIRSSVPGDEKVAKT